MRQDWTHYWPHLICDQRKGVWGDAWVEMPLHSEQRHRDSYQRGDILKDWVCPGTFAEWSGWSPVSWRLSQSPKPLIERLSLKLSRRNYSLQFPPEAERSEIPIQLPGKPFWLTYKVYSMMGSPHKMVTIKTCQEWFGWGQAPALDVYLLPDFKPQPLLAPIPYLHCSLGSLAVLLALSGL